MNHTPTLHIKPPYSAKLNDGTWDIVCYGGTIAMLDKWSPEVDEANARFIVTACNSHDELVNMLKRFVNPLCDCPTDQEVLDVLRKAGAL